MKNSEENHREKYKNDWLYIEKDEREEEVMTRVLQK